MKIGIVTPSFYPYFSGVSEHVYNTYQQLKKRGHTVKIITPSLGNDVTDIEYDIYRIGKGIPVFSNGAIGILSFSLRLAKEVKRILNSEDFDLLHIHEPFIPILCLAALKYSKATNIATFHTFRTSSLAYSLFQWFLKKYNNKLHGRIAVSDSARRFISKYFDGEYQVIPNGIDIHRFRNNGVIKRFNDGRFNILFVGRLEPRKGVKYLLKAFPLIKDVFPNSRLIVVGGGPFTIYYRKFVPPSIRRSVFFEGHVPREDLPLYYSTCHVFCSPALGGESFGIVLLEAMASGRAIVASDIEGYRSVIRNEREGMLVPPKDAKAIANAVIRLLSDESLRKKLGENAVRKAREFSWDNITDRIVDYYYETINHHIHDNQSLADRQSLLKAQMG